MSLTFHDHDDGQQPVVTCDHCGLVLWTTGRGLVVWEPHTARERPRPAYFLHKSRCHRAFARQTNGADRFKCSLELDQFIKYVARQADDVAPGPPSRARTTGTQHGDVDSRRNTTNERTEQ